MSIGVRLEDGKGTKTSLEVDSSGAARTIIRPAPPYDSEQTMRAFRQFLTTDGTAGGTKSMLVNGAITNVDFYVPAHATRDRYICIVSFVLADASLSLNQFGNVTALSNGCRFFYSDARGEVDIHDALKTSFNFIRLCDLNTDVGATTSSFIASNVASTSEAILPKLDMRRTFGFPWGLKLRAGTTQRLTMRIRDDCSGVDQFDVLVYGFERFPE